MEDDTEVPIQIVRGTSFYLPLEWVFEYLCDLYPVDISGYSAQMQVRPTSGSTGTPLVDISSEDGDIVIDGPAGKMELNIPKEVTVTVPVGEYVYDLLVTGPTGLVEELIFGFVTVKERVTK